MEITRVTPFLEYYARIRERTTRVVQCIPPDQIEWTYREGKFTFGDMLRHVAGVERGMFAENARMRPNKYPGHSQSLASGFEATIQYFDRLHTESMDILAGLSDEDLQRRCMTPAGTEMPIWKWLRAMVEHEIHHRGQLYIYLAMLDIPTPPLYGLTSEQVRERSSSSSSTA